MTLVIEAGLPRPSIEVLDSDQVGRTPLARGATEPWLGSRKPNNYNYPRNRMLRKLRVRAVAAVIATAATALASIGPAMAVTEPLSNPRIQVHFDLEAGQRPEAIVFEPNGAANLALAGSNQIARVSTRGEVRILATLPQPADGGVNTPTLGYAIATGLVRTWNGTLYVGYVTGTDELNGIWRVRPGGVPQRIAATPGTGFPNGMDLDERTGHLYFADSILGVIWRVPTAGGTPTVWLRSPHLAQSSLLGVNGLKIRDDAVWATNSDNGTLVRIPIRRDGGPGAVEVKATGMVGIDDFDFLNNTNIIIAALNLPNRVELIRPDGSHFTVLDATDGLRGPTTVGIRGRTVYVPSAAFILNEDPNLLLATVTRRR